MVLTDSRVDSAHIGPPTQNHNRRAEALLYVRDPRVVAGFVAHNVYTRGREGHVDNVPGKEKLQSLCKRIALRNTPWTKAGNTSAPTESPNISHTPYPAACRRQCHRCTAQGEQIQPCVWASLPRARAEAVPSRRPAARQSPMPCRHSLVSSRLSSGSCRSYSCQHSCHPLLYPPCPQVRVTPIGRRRSWHL